MSLIENQKCSGCTACVNICPKNCIEMVPDKEGFLYPKIDKSNCIECGLCKKICPINNTEKHLPFFAYAVKNKNDKERNESTSGAIFSVLAKYVLNNKGIVFGCKFNNNLQAEHDFVETYDEIDEFRGAKYVQSNLNDSFKKVKSFLEKGRYVLFSGTPCQIAGLDAYLGKKYEKLIKCDVVCHSVPSPKALESYIKALENKHNKKITKIWFRRKDMYGWQKSNVKLKFDDGSVYQEFLVDTSFMKGFNNGLFNRPSCANCAYKDFKGKSDITIADFWGIENVNEKFSDNIGVSLAFVNTEIGVSLFEKMKENIEFIKVNVEDTVIKNPFTIKSSPSHKNRKDFFDRIDSENFENLVLELLKEE